jgi:hypothetical protein
LGAENLADYYAILELDPGASREEVRNAYIDLVKVWHPDRYQAESARLRERAEEKLRQVNEAYERIRSGTPAPFPQAPVETVAPDRVAPISVLLYPKDFGGLQGYINASGRMVISARFEAAMQFADSVARVRENGRWGFIDRTGGYIIAPEFVDAHDFSEGLAGVVFREKWGYIDKVGRYVVNALYEEAGSFSGGLAAVLWRGKWGFIDVSGKFVVAPRFHAARAFERGWADVRIGTRWGRTNRFGEVFFVDAPEIKS